MSCRATNWWRPGMPPSWRDCAPRARSSSGTPTCPILPTRDTNRSSSFGRTGNAYDVRFSPGGSSGGTVTAVTANMARAGQWNRHRQFDPHAGGDQCVIGVFPTRGLVSIAGIAPLDWLLDNTGPIARTVTDAAIALGVMAGEDPLDPVTQGSAAKAQPRPYEQYLKADALKGKRFGVPAFVLEGTDAISRHPAAVTEWRRRSRQPIRPWRWIRARAPPS